MKRNILLILLVLTVGFVAIVFTTQMGGGLDQGTDSGEIDISQSPENDPLDVASDFVSGWIDAQQATITPSVAEYVAASGDILTTAAAEAILARVGDESVEAITCQATLPARVGSKIVFADDLRAEVSVIARGAEKSPRQAIVTMQRTATDWEIISHECIDLANPVIAEFTFDRAGRLAKGSVPAPYDNTQWHVLYLDGERVGIAPLTFTDQSQCETADETATCAPDQLSENTLVEIKGDLTEAGAVVRQMTLQ